MLFNLEVFVSLEIHLQYVRVLLSYNTVAYGVKVLNRNFYMFANVYIIFMVHTIT